MTHSRGDLLRALSKKLIQLSGNDMINKRLSGKGTGGIFNVCDEIPQFVLNRLMEGKKFKIVLGDRAGGPDRGQHCEEIMYAPFEDGKNATRW